MPPPPALGSRGGVLLVVKKLRLFSASLKVWEKFFGQASSAQWGLRFSLLDTSTRVLEGRWNLILCAVKREKGPKQAHDAHHASSWVCWALKIRYKPQQNAQNTCRGQCLWL